MSNPAESAVAETRNRLIQAAREAFMAEGYRASVEGIAARAGVAKQTLYNHFPSKDELFSESVWFQPPLRLRWTARRTTCAPPSSVLARLSARMSMAPRGWPCSAP